MSAKLLSSSKQPQPTPKAILRGHKAQVHAAVFVRSNDRLVTGDADGYVVVWDLAINRPRAVWRPHENSILGLAEWRRDRLITHGRDNKLIVWKLSADDEPNLSTVLPCDAAERSQPWMLHMLEVNTMNFCAFASCPADYRHAVQDAEELLIAIPNTLATEAVDIFHLPSQRRQQTLKPETGNSKDGMVMALSMFHKDATLTLAVGYENGLAAVVREHSAGSWTTVYKSAPHSQPILSLHVTPDRSHFFTSGADAILAKHPIPNGTLLASPEDTPAKVVNSKHAGQQSLRVRDDGRILATSGWDGTVRVYSAKTLKELAVLKWHKTGCYAVALAHVSQGAAESGDGSDNQSRSQREGSASGETPKDDESGKEDTGASVTRLEGRQGQGPVARTSRLVEVSVKERRQRAAVETHWIVAGSKDGLVSLWEIY